MSLSDQQNKPMSMPQGKYFEKGEVNMFCVLHNLYGIEDGRKAYFRKLGDCFDFVNRKEFASFLTWEEAKAILRHKEWYCKQYNASHMDVEF